MVYAVCLLSSVGYISASHTFGLPSLVIQVLLTFVFLYVGTLMNKSLGHRGGGIFNAFGFDSRFCHIFNIFPTWNRYINLEGT